MSGTSSLLSEAAIAMSALVAAGVLYAGWRKRVVDAAKRPFLTGEVAIADARSALDLRAQRIVELTQSEATLRAQYQQAVATAAVQQDEMAKLQSRLFTLEGENRDLTARAEAAEEAGRLARTRLTDVEEKLETLQRKWNIGGFDGVS